MSFCVGGGGGGGRGGRVRNGSAVVRARATACQKSPNGQRGVFTVGKSPGAASKDKATRTGSGQVTAEGGWGWRWGGKAGPRQGRKRRRYAQEKGREGKEGTVREGGERRAVDGDVGIQEEYERPFHQRLASHQQRDFLSQARTLSAFRLFHLWGGTFKSRHCRLPRFIRWWWRHTHRTDFQSSTCAFKRPTIIVTGRATWISYALPARSNLLPRLHRQIRYRTCTTRPTVTARVSPSAVVSERSVHTHTDLPTQLLVTASVTLFLACGVCTRPIVDVMMYV